MKLAVITPTHLLGELASVPLSYHLVLGQRAITDVAYFRWHQMKAKLGDFIIVDNGAAERDETPVPFRDIVDCAARMNADEVVMPDVIRDSNATCKTTLDKAALRLVPPCRRVIIPQGKCPEEWYDCLDALDAEMEYATIGIPKHTESWTDGRAGLVRYLINHNYHLNHHIHLFGCYNDPVTEIKRSLNVYQWIRGLDTAAPIAYAQHNAQIDELGHHSLDWDKEASSFLIQRNINILREVIYAYYPEGPAEWQ